MSKRTAASSPAAAVLKRLLTTEQIVRGHDTYVRMVATRRANADKFAAELMPVIRELQAAGVESFKGLADALNARGVRTRRGRVWYATTVRNLLKREVSAPLKLDRLNS